MSESVSPSRARRLCTALIAVFFLLFFVVGSVLFALILLCNPYAGAPLVPSLLWTLVFLAGLVLFFLLSRRWEPFRPLCAGALTLFFCLLLVAGYWLQTDPIFDVYALFQGAVELSEAGQLTEQMAYFCQFPNNLGGTLLLSLVFRLARAVGIADLAAVAVVFNCLLLTAAAGLTYLCARRLWGVRLAMTALLCFLFGAVFYLSAPIYYTDTLSLCFPILGFYCYLRAKTARTRGGRAAALALTGLVLAAGFWVKGSVAVLLVAILLDLLLTLPLRRFALPGFAAVLVFLSCLFLQGRVADALLDAQLREQKEIPVQHWIMMGLTGVGAYNADDYDFTLSFPTLEERKTADTQRLLARLRAFTPASAAQFFATKTVYSFGSGLCGTDTMLDDNPLRPNWAHAYCLRSGAHFADLAAFAQGQYFAVFLLALAAAVGALLHRSSARRLLTPALACFGLLLFLSFWEASSRYIFNFAPLLLLCAAGGLRTCERWIATRCRPRPGETTAPPDAAGSTSQP